MMEEIRNGIARFEAYLQFVIVLSIYRVMFRDLLFMGVRNKTLFLYWFVYLWS